MQSSASNVKEYLDSLPEDRKENLTKLRNIILENLPDGFSEVMAYGMISYVVPHSLYPEGYHVNPKQPLPFISIASQKNHVALYHMGIYGNPELLEWFVTESAKYLKGKLDMGKGCIRFKKLDQIPFSLIGELASKISPDQWINLYKSNLKIN